jgi:ribosomal protein S27AE
MFNNIADQMLRAGQEIMHPKPDLPAAYDKAPAGITASSSGPPDSLSFGDFFSQRSTQEDAQNQGEPVKQDGAEVLKSLTSSDDDAANIREIRSVLEQLLNNLCDDIISGDMLSGKDFAEILLIEKVITAELYYSLSKSFKICDESAQNEQINSGSLELLYSLFPYLYNQLTEIYLKKRPLYAQTCPRCGYASETEERVCPKCGYIF